MKIVEGESEEPEYEDSFDMESHWDDLASSLGLEVSAKPILVDDEDHEVAEIADVVVEKVAEPSEEVVEFFEVASESDDDGQESGVDVLSEMFVTGDDENSAADNPSFEKAEDSTSEDDDPFAAFHRPVASKVEDSATGDEPATQAETPVENETHLVVGEDFVEFEVKDLERGNRDGDRRGRRRQREKTDGGGRSRGDRENREPSKLEDQPETRRRKKRRRNPEPSEEMDRESADREGRRRTKSRRDRDESGDRDGESGSGKKKPKIPTWEDAICGVIEKNIKRHKSGSGRGGGRRRRN